MEPSRTEELKKIWVGEPPRLDGPVELVPFDASWSTRFSAEMANIRAALGPKAILIKHVGSTNIPGIDAKPVIDIVLAVLDVDDEASWLPDLGRAGYVLRVREKDDFHRMLNKSSEDAFPVNLHVFPAGHAGVSAMMRFRDYLRAHPEERELYQKTKRELASRIWEYEQDYVDAKSGIINEILARADEISGDNVVDVAVPEPATE